ncbi:hypothetical protein D3C86_1377100 [compost metagenome]
MVAVVGEKAADGFRQHIHGENIVLQDIIDHILGDQRFARPLVKGAGENDGRDRKIDQIFQRLTLFRPRQVDVGNRQRHRFGRMFVTGLQLFKRAAHLHGNAQHLLETQGHHLGEHVAVFRQQNAVVGERHARILHARNAQEIHSAPIPHRMSGKDSRLIFQND